MKQSFKNIILVDFKKSYSWTFLKKINLYDEFKLGGVKTNTRFYHSRIGNISRLLIYFLYPLVFLFKRNKYNVILAWQQFYGINYAFFCRLLGLKKINKLYIMTFIYKKKKGYIGTIYHRYIRFAVKNKYVDRIICFSSAECSYYSQHLEIPKDKFMFIPLGIENKSDIIINKGDYIFSTGRSNRDYDYLVSAVSDTSYKIKIACDRYSLKSPKPNVEILNNCFNEDMLKLMANSFCVMIPLKDAEISSGQLVILQAMSLGKPIIVTSSTGVVDYINNNVNGFIIEKNPEALIKILESLKDNNLYDFVSKNELKTFKNDYTLESMATNIRKLIFDKDE